MRNQVGFILLDFTKNQRKVRNRTVKQIVEKNESREITYLFQTLEKEWERSGRTVTKRKLNKDAIDIFSEYYVRKVKEYEREQEKDEAKSIKKMVKTIKDMSILLRITKKICAKSNMGGQIEKDYITIELDKDERNCLENIIGSED